MRMQGNQSLPQLFKLLCYLCFAVMLGLSYIDVIYLPQKKQLEEQHAAINSLERQLHRLRHNGDGGLGSMLGAQTARDGGAEALKRITALETAIAKISPDLSRALKEAIDDANEKTQSSVVSGEGQTPIAAQESDKHKSAVDTQVSENAAAKPKDSATAKDSPATPPKKRAEAVDSKSGSGIKTASLQPSPKKQKKWRDDDKCGKQYTVTLEGGASQPAECNPNGKFPCCAPSGWCGDTESHCQCSGCHDYSASENEVQDEYSEETSKAIALIIPMRDRGVHLERFRERIQSHAEAWNKKGVKHTWMIFVVEQFDNALFNRGYLFNVGFQLAQDYAKNKSRPFDCVVMHDIDILPLPVVDYGWCRWPNQIAGEIECWGWSVPYPDNVGGVVSLSPHHWKKINGFSNEYDGWGGEDDDFYWRLRQNKLLKGGCHTWCKTGPKPSGPMVYRPPLGKGRFDCLHDGDHTPRQRAPEDGAMWQRLNEMKSGSKRWLKDGISSIVVQHVGPPSESKACETSCSAPEDPEPKVRNFGEIWARVSPKQIPRVGRIRVTLQKCPEQSRPLHDIPAGLEHLRQLIGELFPGGEIPAAHGAKGCSLQENWHFNANFVLVDITLGQALMVGNKAAVVVPDSSLPAIVPEGQAPKKPDREGSEHMVQGQRLTRWIRKLPPDHQGIILVLQQSSSSGELPEWRDEYIKASRRWPMTVPACVAKADFDGSKKYRVTPGTTWCGDGGWTHDTHFMVLRSKTSVPVDNLVSICISYNTKHYTYRFEMSETGCVGQHARTGTYWKHAHTIHTAREASGDRVCVGYSESGEKSKWLIKKAASCEGGGWMHKFSFSAMKAEYTSPFVSACLLVMTPFNGQSPRRLAVGAECGAQQDKSWRFDRELIMLAKKSDDDAHRICSAVGQQEEEDPKKSTSGDRVWRIFRDTACGKQRVVTREGAETGPRTHWKVQLDPPLYVPAKGAGAKLCLCKVTVPDTQTDKANLSDAQTNQTARTNSSTKRTSTKPPYFTWADDDCTMKHSVRETCFHTLSDVDIARYSYLLDEVPTWSTV